MIYSIAESHRVEMFPFGKIPPSCAKPLFSSFLVVEVFGDRRDYLYFSYSYIWNALIYGCVLQRLKKLAYWVVMLDLVDESLFLLFFFNDVCACRIAFPLEYGLIFSFPATSGASSFKNGKSSKSAPLCSQEKSLTTRRSLRLVCFLCEYYFNSFKNIRASCESSGTTLLCSWIKTVRQKCQFIAKESRRLKVWQFVRSVFKFRFRFHFF